MPADNRPEPRLWPGAALVERAPMILGGVDEGPDTGADQPVSQHTAHQHGATLHSGDQPPVEQSIGSGGQRRRQHHDVGLGEHPGNVARSDNTLDTGRRTLLDPPAYTGYPHTE